MKRVINKAYKTELHPTDEQIALFIKHCDAARFAYNWGLERRIKLYKEDKKSTTAITQHKELCELKEHELSWLYEVSKCAPQFALMNLDNAYKHFYRRVKENKKRKKKKKVGFPRFKSRHHDEKSFTLDGIIKVESGRIKLPRIGYVKLKERDYIPEGKPSKATISCINNRWFISVPAKYEKDIEPIVDGDVIGIDLGIKTLATCSNGMVFENSKALKKNIEKVKRYSRSVSRKVKGSQNRSKAKKKLARLNYRVSCIRKDSLHKITTQLARTKPSVIVIEDLNVQGMMQNRKLSRSLADAALFEFRRMMNYKSDWQGTEFVLADRFYASSKMCSQCGHIKEDLKLSDRIYICEECGNVMDRDLNASYNLRDYKESAFYKARLIPDSSPGINAFGEESADAIYDCVKLSSLN